MNAKGYIGNTPLILAANGGHTSIARLLLNHPNISIHDQVSPSTATWSNNFMYYYMHGIFVWVFLF